MGLRLDPMVVASSFERLDLGVSVYLRYLVELLYFFQMYPKLASTACFGDKKVILQQRVLCRCSINAGH